MIITSPSVGFNASTGAVLAGLGACAAVPFGHLHDWLRRADHPRMVRLFRAEPLGPAYHAR